jgi:L-ribulose-5-phosphate 4-epimerase
MGNYDEIKEECYQANLLLPEFKLIDLTFGNVSVAEPGRRVFAIKPSGVDYNTMKADDMVVVDFEGKIIEDSLRPSSDTPTHCRLFQAFEGIRSVVHTHSRNAVAFAQAGRAIPCHLRMAALKCVIAVVHLLGADEVAHTLADCLSQEIEADQFISALADDELRLIVANSLDETTTALDALKRYA